MQLARRVADIPPSITLAITSRVQSLRAAGHPVIAFGAGEPDFDTPESIRRAAIEALESGETHYMPVSGSMEARTAIAEKLQRENGIACGPGDVVISTGAKHSLYLVLQVLIDPGAGHEVVAPTPCWVSYRPMVDLAGGTMVEVPAGPERDFRVDPSSLDAAITPKTRVVLVNSPSNPCGTMLTPDEVGAVAEVIEAHEHIVLVSDEIYEHLVYGDAVHRSYGSIPAIADRVVTVNGMSKAWAMTGWRLGYLCAPGDDGALAKAATRLQSQMTTCVTSFAMAAMRTALEDTADEVEAMRAIFEHRAALMHEGVSRWPEVRCPRPTGAFYVFPEVAAYFGRTTPGGRVLETSVDFAEALVEEVNVAVVPGDDFGGCGHRHVRLSFACSDEDIAKGCDRVERWLRSFS